MAVTLNLNPFFQVKRKREDSKFHFHLHRFSEIGGYFLNFQDFPYTDDPEEQKFINFLVTNAKGYSFYFEKYKHIMEQYNEKYGNVTDHVSLKKLQKSIQDLYNCQQTIFNWEKQCALLRPILRDKFNVELPYREEISGKEICNVPKNHWTYFRLEEILEVKDQIFEMKNSMKKLEQDKKNAEENIETNV